MDAGRHPLIEVITNAEVIGCEGEPGDFRVRDPQAPALRPRGSVRRLAGCASTPARRSRATSSTSGSRRARRSTGPFPQSVPAAYVIDRELSTASKAAAQDPGTAKHAAVVRGVRASDAIDFDMLPEEVELDVGLDPRRRRLPGVRRQKARQLRLRSLPQRDHQPRAGADAERLRVSRRDTWSVPPTGRRRSGSSSSSAWGRAAKADGRTAAASAA